METPVMALQVEGALIQRTKTPARLERQAQPLSARPLSEATDILDTDFEEESDFEEYSPKSSFERVSIVRLSRQWHN